MLVTAAVRTWPCVSCLHVSSSELCSTTMSRGLGTRETCRLSPAGRRPRSGGPTAAGLCVHLWTCVGGCPETPWPGRQLPQHPQGKVLRQLRNAAREPGQRVGGGCARAGCTALPRRRGVRALCPERRLARSTPAPPVGRGLGRPGMLGKAVSPLSTVRFRRVWLRRGRGVNANKLVFPGAGARLLCVSQHSDGSAPPPSSRRPQAAASWRLCRVGGLRGQGCPGVPHAQPAGCDCRPPGRGLPATLLERRAGSVPGESSPGGLCHVRSQPLRSLPQFTRRL